MEQEKIKDLLDKYFGGNTSEEEEVMLRELLGSDSLNDDLRNEFGYLAAPPERIPEPSAGFEERLAMVTRMPADTTLEPVTVNPHHGAHAPGAINLNDDTRTAGTVNPYRTRRRWLTLIGSVAAMAAGLWIISSILREPHGRDTYSDPALAMAEVKTILLNVSERMNTGTSQLLQVGDLAASPEELKGLSGINQVVERNLSRLRYLGDLYPDNNDTETN
jgi:hypothetical protein